MTLGFLLLIVVLVIGAYMAWTIGANDVANAMGTSVGSGALTLTAAIVLAAIFEFGGAVLIGSSVTETVSRGIIEVSHFEATGPWGADGPILLAVGMVCALLGAAIWLHIATHFGLPVSTTHSIVGAIVGIGIVSFGIGGVAWGAVGRIAASWIVSPLLGGLLAFLSFYTVRRLILRNPDPVAATKRYSPHITAVVVAVMTLSFIYKVLQNRMEAPPFGFALGIAIALGAVIGLLAGVVVRRTSANEDAGPYNYVERIFAFLQIATACFVAFAHGANDVSNAVGPVATVVSLYHTDFTGVSSSIQVPFWVLVMGGAGIVIGLATLGYRVIATIGRQITEITPTRGFAAEFGAATTVLLASSLGLPVSTTHTLVGGVIGIGFAQGMGALNLGMIRNIVNSWLATIPVAATFAAVLFVIARAFVI